MSTASGQSTEDLCLQLARCQGRKRPGGVLRAPERRRHRRDREGRQRRPDDPVEPDQQPVRRDRLPGQPEAAERAGDQGLPEHRGRARAGRPGGHRHARADGART